MCALVGLHPRTSRLVRPEISCFILHAGYVRYGTTTFTLSARVCVCVRMCVFLFFVYVRVRARDGVREASSPRQCRVKDHEGSPSFLF